MMIIGINKPILPSYKRSHNKGGGFTMNESNNDNKKKFPLWMYQDSYDMVENLYKGDDCKSRSEFIEKAVNFYSGYLYSNKSGDYLPNILTSTLKSIVKESTDRTNRLLFKMNVELAMAMNVIVASNDFDENSLAKLRGECVKAVKKTNGNYSFDDAVKWQKG
jgi:hypothetical protein